MKSGLNLVRLCIGYICITKFIMTHQGRIDSYPFGEPGYVYEIKHVEKGRNIIFEFKRRICQLLRQGFAI